jgi:hypothetical protein
MDAPAGLSCDSSGSGYPSDETVATIFRLAIVSICSGAHLRRALGQKRSPQARG